MTAYDYDNQKWITNELDARVMRATQLLKDKEILESARGEAFARFVNGNRIEMLAVCNRELATLGFPSALKSA